MPTAQRVSVATQTRAKHHKQPLRSGHRRAAEPVRFDDVIHLRAVLRIVIVGLLIYLLVAGFGGLSLSLSAIVGADPIYIGLAMLAIFGSYIAAAMTYMFLSPRKLRFIPSLIVQLAGCLVNRLFPAGLGGLGINTMYLGKRGLSLPLAAAVVAMNTFLGFVGNALLLVLVIIFGRLPSVQLKLPPLPSQPLIFIGLAVLIAMLLMMLKRHISHRLRLSLRDAVKYLRTAALRPLRTLMALGSSMTLTALHALGLYLVLHAVGVPQPWGAALLAVSVGSAAGAAVPTPGGLGGAEAGIAAVLIAFGVSADNAVAAALVYRGITYWLPLLPGYLALRVAESRYL